MSPENLEQIVKAKIAIVTDCREILLLTRSEIEDTRIGELDLPGGTLESTDTSVLAGALREASEELPGTVIVNPIELGQPHIKFNELGQRVITHVLGATAIFPPDGIKLSGEHSAFRKVPIPAVDRLTTRPDKLPKKYIRAITENPFEFEWLLYQHKLAANKAADSVI